MEEPTWSVVTTCAEPRLLLEAFIEYHLNIGAQEVFIFLDDPTDGFFDIFSQIPGVTAINCDSKFWAERKPKKGRPKDHRLRQVHNAEYAAKKLCKSEWLAHIDGDELMYPRAVSSISQALANVPVDIDAVRVLPAERMFFGEYTSTTPSFKGVYKLPGCKKDIGFTIYDDLGYFFPDGFQGHTQGKSFKRCRNQTAHFNIHFVRKDGGNIPEYVVPVSDVILLHAFPLSYEDWKHKYERRIDNHDYFSSVPKKAQRRFGVYKSVREDGGEKNLLELFSFLCVFPDDHVALLDDEECFMRIEEEPYSIARSPMLRNVVEPYISLFSSKMEENIPDSRRIFIDGRCCARNYDLVRMFENHGFSYAFFPEKSYLQLLKDGKSDFLNKLGGYQVVGAAFTDSEYSVLGVERVASLFPNSIYIAHSRGLGEVSQQRNLEVGGDSIRGGEREPSATFGEGSSVTLPMVDVGAFQFSENPNINNNVRILSYCGKTTKPHVFFSRLNEMIGSGG